MIKLSFLIAFSIASILTGISNDLIDSGSKSTDGEKKVEWVLVWEDNFEYEGFLRKALMRTSCRKNITSIT